MQVEKACPVCGQVEVSPILRKVRVDTSSPVTNATVLAYRCPNGHFFVSSSTENEESPLRRAA